MDAEAAAYMPHASTLSLPAPAVMARLQEKAGYVSELEALIEQMEGLVADKAQAEADRGQLAQHAAELAEQLQATRVRNPIRQGSSPGASTQTDEEEDTDFVGWQWNFVKS